MKTIQRGPGRPLIEQSVFWLLIALVSFKLGWDMRLPMVLLFALIIWWLIWHQSEQPPVPLSKWLIPLAFLFLLGVRLVPFFQHPAPLGYDTGLYRGVQQTYLEALPNLPDFVPNSLPSIEFVGVHIATDLLAPLHLPPDILLYGLYFLTQIMLAGALFMVGKEFGNERVAILAVVLYSLSATLFGGFEFMLLKNFFALPFMLLTFVLLNRHSWLASLSIALVAGTHLPTFAILSLGWLGFLIFQRHRRYLILVYLTGLIVALPMLLLNEAKIQSIVPYVQTLAIQFSEFLHWSSLTNQLHAWFGTNAQAVDRVNTELQFSPVLTGIFLELKEYLVVAAPLVIAAVAGTILAFRKTSTRVLGWTLIVTGAFVAAGLIFQNRLVIHLDVFVVLLAAVALDLLLRRVPSSQGVLAIFGLAIFLLGSLVIHTLQSFQPLMTREDMATIQALNTAIPKKAYLVTIASRHAPWLYGYTHANVIAPGMFEHTVWKKAEWDEFVVTDDPVRRRELLDRYAGPVYLYLTPEEEELPILDDPAFEYIAPNLYVYQRS